MKISVSSTQAKIIRDALQIYFRLGIGQFRPALDKLPKPTEFNPDWHDDMGTIGKILSKHMIDNIDGWQRHLGISSDKVDTSAKIACDMYQAIKYWLAWDTAITDGIVKSMDDERVWDKMQSNIYDKPFKIADEPMAEIS
jgi:hypothetical protein